MSPSLSGTLIVWMQAIVRRHPSGTCVPIRISFPDDSPERWTSLHAYFQPFQSIECYIPALRVELIRRDRSEWWTTGRTVAGGGSGTYSCWIERVTMMPEWMIVMGGVRTDRCWIKDRGSVDVRGRAFISNYDDMGWISILNRKVTIHCHPFWERRMTGCLVMPLAAQPTWDPWILPGMDYCGPGCRRQCVGWEYLIT